MTATRWGGTMKVAGILISVMTMLSCSSAGSGGPVAHRLIANGTQAQSQTDAQQVIYVATDSRFQAEWRRIAGGAQQPPVDFSREDVVFVVSSSKPTGGYTLNVRGVTRKDDVIVVDAAVAEPPPGSMTIQVITRPYAVIAIPKGSVKRVTWDDTSSEVTKQSSADQ